MEFAKERMMLTSIEWIEWNVWIWTWTSWELLDVSRLCAAVLLNEFMK